MLITANMITTWVSATILRGATVLPALQAVVIRTLLTAAIADSDSAGPSSTTAIGSWIAGLGLAGIPNAKGSKAAGGGIVADPHPALGPTAGR